MIKIKEYIKPEYINIDNLKKNCLIINNVIQKSFKNKNTLKKEIFYHIKEINVLYDKYIINKEKDNLYNEFMDLFILLKIKYDNDKNFNSLFEKRIQKFIENIGDNKNE